MIPTIKAGYRVTVNSWENDLDYRNTEVLDGLTREDVEFIVDLCQCMRSTNDPSYTGPSFGNLYDPDDERVEEFHRYLTQLAEKHGRDPDPESVEDTLSDLGLILIGDFYTRVCESFKVELIPQDVFFEDVTSQFLITN